MSYARWSNSDLYVYHHVSEGLVCECCQLVHGPAGYWIDRDYTSVLGGEFKRGDVALFSGWFCAGYDAEAMLRHLDEHAANGDDVGDAIEELRAEVNAGEWD